MNGFSERINRFIKKHKLERTRRILAVGLSLIVASSVFSYLILPAMSATLDAEVVTDNTFDVQLFSEANSEYDAILNGFNSATEADKTDIAGFVTGAEFKDPAYDPATDTVSGKITVQYESNNKGATQYLYLQLDKKVSKENINKVYELEGNPTGEKTEIVGDFIITEDGKVIIKFRDKFLQYYKDNYSGNFEFGAKIKRNEGENGTQTEIQIGNQTVVITGFKKLELALAKSGVDKKDGTIEWKVEVDNPGTVIGEGTNDEKTEPHDLKDYVLSDTMFKAGAQSVKCVDSSGKEITLVDKGDGTYTFPEGSTDKKYTITYRTKLTDAQLKGLDVNTNPNNGTGTVTNTATLKKPDGGDGPSDSGEVKFELGYNLSKTGSLDYTDPMNPKIKWTLTVKNKYNRPVDGLDITDQMFPTDVSEITFTPDTVTGTLSGGKLTLASNDANNKYTGDVTVSFSTEVKDTDISTGTVTNKAKLPGMPEVSKTVNTKPFDLGKSGWGQNWNGNKNYWYINITNISCDNKDLNGYYLIDSNLPNRVDKEACGNQDFTSRMDSNNILIKINGKEIADSTKYCTIDDNGKLTFKNLDSYSEQINHIEIQYVTQPSEEINNPSYNFKDTNTVNAYTPGDKPIGGSTAEIPWHKEEVKPSISYNKVTNGSYTDNKDGTLTLPWKITFTGKDGGTLADLDKKEFTDTLSSENGVSQFMTEAQLNAMVFKAKDKNNFEVKLEKDKDYSIIYVADTEGKLTSFTLKLAEDSEKLSQVTNLEITYNSTADVKNVTLGNKIWIANTFDTVTNSHGYEKIDESSAPYDKYDASVPIATQSGTTHKKQSKLKTVSINGVDYYKFDYQIDVNKNGSKFTGPYTLTDTLPDGFEIYNNTVTIIRWAETNCVIDAATNTYQDWNYKLELKNNQLVITEIPTGADNYAAEVTFKYSLVIPKDDFDKKLAAQGSVSITNSIKSDTETHKEITQTQVVEKEQVTKQTLSNSKKGLIEYEVAINPEGKILNGGAPIPVEDILKATGFDPGAVMVTLDSLQVFEVDKNGNETKLDESQYRYVLDNSPTAASSNIKATVSDMFVHSAGQYGYKISGVPAGASGTIVLKKTSPDVHPYVWVGKGNSNDSGIYANWGDPFGSSDTLTISVDSTKTDGSDLFVVANTEDYIIESATFGSGKAVYPYAAKLSLTVPDGKYLKIRYQYRCSFRNADSGKEGVVNTVNVNSTITTNEASKKDTIEIDGDGGGSVYTKGTYKLQKVDVGDYSTHLSADFNLYMCDGGVWKPATSFELVKTDKDEYYKPTYSNDTSGTPATLTVPELSCRIYLDSGMLYKLVEIKQPEGYAEANMETEKYFYSGTKLEVALPEGVTNSQVTLLPNSGKLNIQNYKDISIRAVKKWALGYDRHTNDLVELTLMRSHTKSSTLPDDAEKVEISGLANPVTVDAASQWATQWNNLPSGTVDGKPWYYYIKETKVLINGVESSEYTAYYAGNGKNVNSTITVTNTAGLTIMKKWLSNDNTEGKPTVESVRFRLYRSLLPPNEVESGTVPSDGELIKDKSSLGFEPDKNGWYTLSSSTNNWSVTFKGLDPYKGDDVNARYYYYVVEDTSNLSQNVVSYLGNGTGSQGVITINNKSTKITVGEMPSTGGPGTLAYTLTGGLIIICSAAAYVVRKRLLRE